MLVGKPKVEGGGGRKRVSGQAGGVSKYMLHRNQIASVKT